MTQTQVRFTVYVHDEPDGSYWAEVKELPGCFASGFDLDELKAATYEAMQLWLPDGITLGEPTWTPIDDPKKKSPRGSTVKTRKKKASAKRKMLVCA